MMTLPKVSVLMPIYKTNPQYLCEAIDSILKQTFTDFEFLILDDCPDDTRENIVKSYQDSRIRYLKNDINLGISETRNKLIDLARGEYLAVFDHDDIALPERLEKEALFLDNNPQVGVVGSWYLRFPEIKVKKRIEKHEDIEKDLMYHCSILHPSSMIRKSVLQVNGLQYEKQFSPAEDYALWCRLIGKTQFANIPEILHKYRDYDGNTSKFQRKKMQQATIAIHHFVRTQHPELWRKARLNHFIKQIKKIFSKSTI